MDKENMKLLYIQIIDCIDTLINNSRIEEIKEIKKIMKNIYSQYLNKDILIKDIEYLAIIIDKIYKNNNNYDNKLKIYIKRLYNNYHTLSKIMLKKC